MYAAENLSHTLVAPEVKQFRSLTIESCTDHRCQSSLLFCLWMVRWFSPGTLVYPPATLTLHKISSVTLERSNINKKKHTIAQRLPFETSMYSKILQSILFLVGLLLFLKRKNLLLFTRKLLAFRRRKRNLAPSEVGENSWTILIL